MLQKKAMLIIAFLLMASFIVPGFAGVQPAAATCGGITTVSNESELNTAIAAFNAVGSGPCIFTIQLNDNIDLTASTTTINNATSGVNLVIEGANFTVDGQGTSDVRPFEIAINTDVTMNEITIQGGRAPFNTRGGGILNSGNLTINYSTITGNQSYTGFGGGGIANGTGVPGGPGTLTVNNSTISNNTAPSSFGGGISNFLNSTATINNSTISGNTANNGGGVANERGTLVEINNSTIRNNSGSSATTGGGLFIWEGTAAIRNSIIADQASGYDCVPFNNPTITDNGYNLVETQNGCGFVDGTNNAIVGEDPLLLPLANNGGPTQTHALNDGSPALEQIPEGTTGCVTSTDTDQRNEPRPGTRNVSTNRCEMGAWEAQTEDPTAISLSSFSSSRQAPLPMVGLVVAFLAILTLFVGLLRRQPKQIGS